MLKSNKGQTLPKIGRLVDTNMVNLENKRVEQLSLHDLDFRNTLFKDSKEQKIREEKAFSSTTVCMVDTNPSSVRDNLGNLDSAKITELADTNFYDPNIMKSIGCLSEAIMALPPGKKGSVSYNERTRRWISELRQIGTESVEGFAMKGNLSTNNKTLESKQLFILKAPRDASNNELLHEWFIGVEGTNKLRYKVPNFAYIYGGLQCSPPVISPAKDVVAWCNNTKNNVNYVVYESIAPAKSFRQYVSEGCTFKQWLNIYLQILYSIDQAVVDIDFTHYDLHDENVLVRDVKSYKNNDFWIPYVDRTSNEDTEVYLLSNRIATIIDYGLSHIKVGDHNYGVYDRMPWAVYPDRSFPMHDAYKLLLMSMRTMLEAIKSTDQTISRNATECFEKSSEILKFFNVTETPVDIVEKQAKTYYFIPLTYDTASLQMSDLIRFIKDRILKSSGVILEVSRPTQNIMGCTGTDICVVGTETLKTIGVYGYEKIAHTVFDFYDLITRFTKQRRTDLISELEKNVNYTEIINRAIVEFNKISDEYNKYSSQPLDNIDISRLLLLDMMSSNVLKSYKYYVSRVAFLFDLFQRFKLHRDAMVYTATYYGDLKKAEQIKQIWTQTKGARTDLNELINDIINTSNEAQQKIYGEKDLSNQILERDPEQMWWIKGLPGVLLTMT